MQFITMTKATLTLRSSMLNCAVALNVAPCGCTQKLATLSVQDLLRDKCSSSVKALSVNKQFYHPRQIALIICQNIRLSCYSVRPHT
ncbi:hypothetical protein PoB_001581400 [Plakobranchus ocellatus]|uniref:Secreted protein n=1 Tax=Plakobranchus ocellatus TaxID=259542 RepID=A0AAV3Z1W8_9GAST|nr:hypothetical protein PoB_001581400 [Plakobranchus ocellatus]